MKGSQEMCTETAAFRPATDIRMNWCSDELSFDCPCGEKDIILSESGNVHRCKCGRLYYNCHYVGVISGINWQD